MRHHRDQRDERRREERHQRDRADGGAAGRLGPGRGVNRLAERGQQAGRLAGGRGQPDEAEGQHHGQERGCVGHEGDRIAERRYRRPGQRRAGDPTEVELGRVQRRRRPGSQTGGTRSGRMACWNGPISALRRALHGDQRHQRGRAGPARGHQHGQQQGGARGGQVAQDQDRPAGQPVGQRAADRRQQADRQEPAGRHQHGPGGLPVSEMTSAPTATVCIQEPIVETRPAVHSKVKARCRNGCRPARPRVRAGAADAPRPVRP